MGIGGLRRSRPGYSAARADGLSRARGDSREDFRRPKLRFGSLTLVLGLGALILAGAAAIALGPRFGAREPPRFVAVTLGAERFTLASAYLKGAARRGGAADALELAAFFPDFSPAGDLSDVTAGADLAERFQRIVFVTAKPSDSSLDPAERPVRLYQRFLDENSWSHPGGLIARAFEDGSPFEGDELYYVAPEGREFAARCRRPDPERKTPNTCIYDFRLGDLDVETRFSAALLAEWASLKAGARGLIEAARR
jgi:hypothetical protein